MKDKQISIAIIGSGPSGCFTAQFLRKNGKMQISLFLKRFLHRLD